MGLETLLTYFYVIFDWAFLRGWGEVFLAQFVSAFPPPQEIMLGSYKLCLISFKGLIPFCCLCFLAG